MANTYKGQYTSSIRGDVQPYEFTYHPISDSVFRAIGAINDMYDKRDEALGNVTKAINTVPLDHSEDAYKTKFIEKYTNLIKQNPYKAQEYANEAANDREFQLKARAHQEHLAFENHLDDWAKNGTIDEITAERLKKHSANQYKFIPTLENGKVVSAQKWEAGKQAVRHIPPLEILQAVKNIVNPTTTNRRTSTGGTTTNADGTGRGGQTVNDTQTIVLDPKKLRTVFDAAFQSMPGAEDSLMQDYEDDQYRLQKYAELRDAATSDEERNKYENMRKAVYNRLYKSDGTAKSTYEYMADSMGVVIKNAGRNDTSITRERINNVDNYSKSTGTPTYSMEDLEGLGIDTSIFKKNGMTTVAGNVTINEKGEAAITDVKVISRTKFDENGNPIE